MSRASFGGGRMLVGARGVADLCRIGFEDGVTVVSITTTLSGYLWCFALSEIPLGYGQ